MNENNNQFKIYGYHPILEALKQEKSVQKIFINRDRKTSKISELIKILIEKKIHYTFVPKEKLRKLGDKNQNGLVAMLSPVDLKPLEEVLDPTQQQTFIILDQVVDIGNMGAIIRSADCSGASAIIIAGERTAPINESVVNISSGAVFNIPICKERHIKDAIHLLKQHDVKIIAATEKATKTLYELNQLDQSVAIIMGSEERGIQKTILKEADEQVKIPIFGKTESLNVSVAAGVMLYELIRKKHWEQKT